MAKWDGFTKMTSPDGSTVVHADYAAPDDDPTPLCVISQRVGRHIDDVELTEADLRWIVDEVAPVVLARMGERP